MGKTKMRALIELIDELVQENEGSWRDRRDRLLTEATDDEALNVHEFAAWFEEDD